VAERSWFPLYKLVVNVTRIYSEHILQEESLIVRQIFHLIFWWPLAHYSITVFGIAYFAKWLVLVNKVIYSKEKKAEMY
jgi:hypothetical protein